MRIVVLTLCLMFCSATGVFASSEVFFVPGWRTGYSSREGCVRILRGIYPGLPITVKSWDSDRLWPTARRNAAAYTLELKREILAMPETRRRELILIGHSIGANIVLDVLNTLAERKLKIHGAALLGGAIPNNDPRIRRALDAVYTRCYCIFSPGDGVLKLLYPLDNPGTPLGTTGWIESDPRWFEAPVEEADFSFYHHFAYRYIEGLARLIRSLPPEHAALKVLQGTPNREIVPGDAELFWDTAESCENWKLQRHALGAKYRILDPAGIRRASGDEARMREAFEDVRKQLKRE